MYHCYVITWQVHARVVLGDGRIVPPGDLSLEDIGERLPPELEPALCPLEVVRGNDGTADRRNVLRIASGILHLIILHRGVGGTEVNGLISELFDTSPGSYGLVVNLDPRVLG